MVSSREEKAGAGRISVVINTYNAERHLEAVLAAATGFDEVVVCDMESTDRTVEIAQSHGCKVVLFPKKDYTIVEPARSFAIRSATSEWVLVVDADELITAELRSYLYEQIRRADCPAGLYIARHNMVFGAYEKGWSTDYQLRFFVREGTEWPTYIHAVPNVPGTVSHAPRHCVLKHLDDATVGQWIGKMSKYTDYEVEKKAGKNYGLLALFCRPVWRFFKSYVMNGGFLNGRRGVMQACQWAIYQQVLVLKMLERKLRQS